MALVRSAVKDNYLRVSKCSAALKTPKCTFSVHANSVIRQVSGVENNS